jgi:hypothetical protein
MNTKKWVINYAKNKVVNMAIGNSYYINNLCRMVKWFIMERVAQSPLFFIFKKLSKKIQKIIKKLLTKGF